MFNFIDFILGWIMSVASHRTDKDKSGIQHGHCKRKATVWGIGIGAAGLAYNVYKGQTGGKGEKGGRSGIKQQDYYIDPYYQSSQKTLSGFGTNLLQGQPNDYYKPIGEIGGQMFEDMLSKGKRDISTSITEDFARRNVRGARASNVIAKQVGDFSTDLRYKDMMRALEGRGFLMQQGSRALSGVRSGALTQSGDRNAFNLGQQGLTLDREKFAYSKDADKAGMWGDILGSAIGAGANIYGAYTLGKANTPTKYKDPKGNYNVGYGKGNYPGGYAGMAGY